MKLILLLFITVGCATVNDEPDDILLPAVAVAVPYAKEIDEWAAEVENLRARILIMEDQIRELESQVRELENRDDWYSVEKSWNLEDLCSFIRVDEKECVDKLKTTSVAKDLEPLFSGGTVEVEDLYKIFDVIVDELSVGKENLQ